jgi:hypothetical protein
MENVWDYLRQNKLRARVWGSYEAIVDACEQGWGFLINDPARIRSISTREWARVNVQGGWYYSMARMLTEPPCGAMQFRRKV